MVVFLIDPNIDGILCAFFKAFTEKVYPYKVHSAYAFLPREPKVNTELVRVETDKAHAERVKKALLKYGGDRVIYQLRACLASCESLAFTHAFCYGYKMLNERRNIREDLCDVFVSNFFYTVQKVLGERERALGGLRFSEKICGILYARFSPDNDITEFVAPFFVDKLHQQPFVIHDLKRNRIAISDGDKIKYGYTNLKADFRQSQKEQEIERLWERYFSDVNILEHKNLAKRHNILSLKQRKYML